MRTRVYSLITSLIAADINGDGFIKFNEFENLCKFLVTYEKLYELFKVENAWIYDDRFLTRMETSELAEPSFAKV